MTMEREVAWVHDQVGRAFAGPAWHGPAVRDVLRDLSATSAAGRPVAGVHSIWELVHHITAWKAFLRRRLEGEAIAGVTPADDWPAVAATTDAAWAESLASLEAAHQALRDTIAKLTAARLGEPLASEPGTTETVYTSLLGLVQHDLYHAGQIAVIRRAGGS